MITQKLMQGSNEIRIETAESIEDAKKNKFPEGEYSRYFVNEKPVKNYMTLIQYMVEETKKTGKSFVPEKIKALEIRNKILRTHNEELKKHIQDIKNKCSEIGMNQLSIDNLNSIMEKIDAFGVRVSE